MLDTVILSLLWGDLLDRFNITSKKLQAADVYVSVVAVLYDSFTNYVASVREDFDLTKMLLL